MQLSPNSFAIFVYPFSFDRSRFDALVTAVDGDALSVAEAFWPIWGRRPFPHDDLLRHVADYLNPGPGVPATACLWTLEERVLTSPRGLALRAGTLSLCLRQRMKDKSGSLAPGQTPEGAIALDVTGIDLALFRVGMGYLILRVRVQSQAPEDWSDVLNAFRYVDRAGKVDLLFRRRTGKDSIEPFFPPLADPSDEAAHGRGVTRHLIGGLLRRLIPGPTPGPGPGGYDWWREVFVPGQLLPFHALFFTAAPEPEQAPVLYRLRNFFRADQSLVPSAADLRPDHPALLPYAQQMWFSVTLEGGGFVAFDAPDTPFWSKTMPDHLHEQYFLLFLLALHQRFTLMDLSNQVCAGWLSGDDGSAEGRFADLREALLEFTARGYFNQVMQRDHHHRCFRAWQEVFETERLYREVTDEVRELHGMLLMRKTERIQRLAEEQRRLLDAQTQAEALRERAAQARSERIGTWLGGIAFLLGFPSLVLSFLQVIQQSDPRLAVAALALSLVVGGVLMFGVRLWLRRSRGPAPEAGEASRDAGGD